MGNKKIESSMHEKALLTLHELLKMNGDELLKEIENAPEHPLSQSLVDTGLVDQLLKHKQQCEHCEKYAEPLDIVDYVCDDKYGFRWTYELVCEECFNSRTKWCKGLFPEVCDRCKDSENGIYLYSNGKEVKGFKIPESNIMFLCKNCAIKQDSIKEDEFPY